jgi:SAM-dependent methyltransferase
MTTTRQALGEGVMMKLNWLVLAEEWGRGTLRDPAQHFRVRRRRDCPCCGYTGYFVTAKRRGPADFRCPNCSSRPRDRQIALWLKSNAVELSGKKILHFAPEWPLFRQLKDEPGYVGGDIQRRRNANAIVNVTAIDYPDAYFDILICNHVLEHVPDDNLAMRETYRVLRPGGMGIFSVPMSGDAATWEPPPGMSAGEVDRICGWDHKRLYGQDFGAKLASVGYTVRPYIATPDQQVRHALFDETIFMVVK